jgi:hypothetical protein
VELGVASPGPCHQKGEQEGGKHHFRHGWHNRPPSYHSSKELNSIGRRGCQPNFRRELARRRKLRYAPRIPLLYERSISRHSPQQTGVTSP